MSIGFAFKYKSIKNQIKNLKQKTFFLKVWAKNMVAQYTQEHIIGNKI